MVWWQLSQIYITRVPPTLRDVTENICLKPTTDTTPSPTEYEDDPSEWNSNRDDGDQNVALNVRRIRKRLVAEKYHVSHSSRLEDAVGN